MEKGKLGYDDILVDLDSDKPLELAGVIDSSTNT